MNEDNLKNLNLIFKTKVIRFKYLYIFCLFWFDFWG
jgi:hypothetical protein